MVALGGSEEYAANLAMGHLGQREIATLSDNNTRTRAVRQFFAIARDATLRLKWWNFATAWVTPAADATASNGTLKIRFPLPADCIRVRFIEGADDDSWAIESATLTVGGVPVEASILVTSITNPNVCYTRRVESPRLWDVLFLEQFGYELAACCARKCGKSAAYASNLRAIASEKLRIAGGIDSKEKARETPRPETSWASARRGRSRFYR
ncbi:hypothetical protein ONR75_24060 [Rhodopseudomonas sp. P2A-2r]|uniref:hypothetical protein n=1 Tax=Rhodopseudomonas sp. P2A-2r TaxID=2991972 RepID=UPI002234500E|nr:hypothetical protein [Rhodopseudomonas sp. P2A-2r]UZE47914.1 hypothetical protein ONR75_24060 [Rhodopseudomonas sp. P2A-2r]